MHRYAIAGVDGKRNGIACRTGMRWQRIFAVGSREDRASIASDRNRGTSLNRCEVAAASGLDCTVSGEARRGEKKQNRQKSSG